jgi:predicted transglutaminase-like cysteine proteinase
MKARVFAVLSMLALMSLGFDPSAQAGPTIATGDAVVPPVGYIVFCVKHSKECLISVGKPDVVDLTNARRAELDRVQADVNWQVKPRANPTHAWQYAVDGYGDCNTYALTKRQALIALGWPEDALLLAAVYDELGEGHLILVARTNKGDFVLDNRLKPVVAWNTLPYRWVSMQSQQSPARWVSVVDRPVMMAKAEPRP